MEEMCEEEIELQKKKQLDKMYQTVKPRWDEIYERHAREKKVRVGWGWALGGWDWGLGAKKWAREAS